jgi:hypothetical protein
MAYLLSKHWKSLLWTLFIIRCVLTLQRKSNIVGRVDHELAAQFPEQLTYWREVLKRVVATVKSLASRGLPFRGHDEKLGSLHNGNYLMTLELIAEFDPFLSKHIAQYGGKGKDVPIT